MDYTPSQKKIYISEESTTFEFDSSLTKLPIPDLKQTLDKYLTSIEPFVSSDDYEEALEASNHFLQSGQGANLQKLLKNKSEVCYNSIFTFTFKIKQMHTVGGHGIPQDFDNF